MKKRQIRRGIGKYLQSVRESKRMPLSEVIAYLSLQRVKCSKSNLSRIEADNKPCRSDILAGLCTIYDLDANEVLFRSI
jgi:transcriptional regulator with XRE-family HTH domain